MATLDIRALIDEQPVGRLQKWVVALGFLIIALDGFDVAIMGFIAPQLRMDWSLTPQALAPVLSAALMGLALGALTAGPLADRFGRRRILLVSVALFGVFTLASAFSRDLTELVVLRFLTGVGLGAAMPNASILVSEYAPQRRRSLLITLAFCGFSLGAAVGGFASAWMIPNLGWRSVLFTGGVLPLLALPLLAWRLPESITLLVARKADPARVLHLARRLCDSPLADDTRFLLPASPEPQRGAIRLVLSRRYLFGTLMLWAGYVIALFMVYLFSGWLPTLVKEGAHYSVSQAAIVTALFQIGGPLGAIFTGWAMDRFNRRTVLAMAFIGCGVAVAAIGQVSGDYLLLCAMAWVVGFGLNGVSVGMNALAAHFYPTAARATGASWMSGVGRLGAVMSAFAGGQMLGMGWSLTQICMSLLIPALLGAIAVGVQGWQWRQEPRTGLERA